MGYLCVGGARMTWWYPRIIDIDGSIELYTNIWLACAFFLDLDLRWWTERFGGLYRVRRHESYKTYLHWKEHPNRAERSGMSRARRTWSHVLPAVLLSILQPTSSSCTQRRRPHPLIRHLSEFLNHEYYSHFLLFSTTTYRISIVQNGWEACSIKRSKN